MGLVNQVFNDTSLAALQGHLAIGHCRYSTTGASTVGQRPAAVPRDRRPGGGLALGHNGNLVNTAELARQLDQPADQRLRGDGRPCSPATSWLVARRHGVADVSLDDAIVRAAPRAAWGVLGRGDGREPAVRLPRPARGPSAADRPARQRRLGRGLRDRRRSTSSAPSTSATSPPARSSPSTTDGLHSAPLRRGRRRPTACSSGSTSPAPTTVRTAAASCSPAAAWAASSPARRRSTPTS